MTLGPSQESIPEFHRLHPEVKCDIFSVDGDHSTEGTYEDLKNFRSMATCRNWVLNLSDGPPVPFLLSSREHLSHHLAACSLFH